MIMEKKKKNKKEEDKSKSGIMEKNMVATK